MSIGYLHMRKIITNEQILEFMFKLTETENYNQLGSFLEDKYSIKNGRQKINQFKNAKTTTITTLFFNELMLGK
jgi:hypothetical protein